VRQPKALDEALATVRMLEEKGYNFSIGLAQVNRYNLGKYGLDSYEKAFQQCPNLQAGSRILADCYKRSGGDWGKSFSCYYSGNFETGFRHGYVQKIYDSIRRGQQVASNGVAPIDVVSRGERRSVKVEHHPQLASPAQARIVARPVAGVRAVGRPGTRLCRLPIHRCDGPRQPAEHRRPGGVARGAGFGRSNDAATGAGRKRLSRSRLRSSISSLVRRRRGSHAAAAAGLGCRREGPVMLRPWSERNQPVAVAQNFTTHRCRLRRCSRFPQGMRPSCSDEVVVRPVPRLVDSVVLVHQQGNQSMKRSNLDLVQAQRTLKTMLMAVDSLVLCSLRRPWPAPTSAAPMARSAASSPTSTAC
jgi:type IV secretion system protein VirB1